MRVFLFFLSRITRIKRMTEQLDLFGEPIQQDKPKRRKPNPDSEIIVAIVSLFGTTEDMMLTEMLSTDEADKLIMLAKRYGTNKLIRRLINSL